MHTLRFGRKLSLPSTIAIKHQFRTFMARHEVEEAEAEGRVEAFHSQANLAGSSVTTMSEIDASALPGHIRPL
jgi:hypothetical protein